MMACTNEFDYATELPKIGVGHQLSSQKLWSCENASQFFENTSDFFVKNKNPESVIAGTTHRSQKYV